MTKCTLCVDRIYDEKMAPEDRKPACVQACPTGARLFGDVKDPESEVSKAIRERGGYSLMPEWGTQPANQYLPRQRTGPLAAGGPAGPEVTGGPTQEGAR
jgi:Fe-S-cluster-containing dehydrogenase component